MTPYKSSLQLFAEKWLPCTNCDLSESRDKTVLLRGSVPCEILFVGEAPGFSEDAIGQPFVGPAGHRIDMIVKRALAPEGVMTRSVCFTNLVCCLPLAEDGAHKFEEPDADHILACQPRLAEFINLCKPKLIVRTGKLATGYLSSHARHALKIPPHVRFLDMLHPGFIIRANIANRELLTQRCVVQLSNAAEDLDDVPAWGEDDEATISLASFKRNKKAGTLEGLTGMTGEEDPSDPPDDVIPF
jgi:uracil-DNA glycosylase family 4